MRALAAMISVAPFFLFCRGPLGLGLHVSDQRARFPSNGGVAAAEGSACLGPNTLSHALSISSRLKTMAALVLARDHRILRDSDELAPGQIW